MGLAAAVMSLHNFAAIFTTKHYSFPSTHIGMFMARTIAAEFYAVWNFFVLSRFGDFIIRTLHRRSNL